jgi:heme exporter protein C
MAKQDRLGWVLGVAAALMTAVAIYMALGYAPTPQTEVGGDVQRIFYFHVGIAWVAALALLVATAASGLYLWRGEQRKHDILAHVSIEIGVVFGILTILSGMFWARPVWGTWWTWDPRLTWTAITLFIYVAYLMLRGAIDDPQRRARFAAVYGVVAFASVPITYFATTWWNTLHPSPELTAGGLTPTMRAAMFPALIAFSLLYLLLLRARARLETVADEVARLKQRVLTS